MRRIISFLSILFLTVLPLLAQDHTIYVVKPFDNANLLINTTNYSAALDLNGYKPVDFKFALQLQATNLSTATGGIVAVSYELSNNNMDYLSSSNIVTGFSFTNSPTSGGKGFYQFDTGKSRYVRFKAIISQTNSWLDGWLAIQ